jgi:hypothetical protein
LREEYNYRLQVGRTNPNFSNDFKQEKIRERRRWRLYRERRQLNVVARYLRERAVGFDRKFKDVLELQVQHLQSHKARRFRLSPVCISLEQV